MNHYPRHIGDWMVATAHLSPVEECMYSRLIDCYYAREAPLPVDVPACCRLVRATTAQERRAVLQSLNEFFVLAFDGWHQKRCDNEIARFREKSAKASTSASARWSTNDANAMRTHSERNANQNQEPVTRSKAIEAPTPEHRAFAVDLAVNCDEEWQKYRDYLKAHGKRHKDEAAGFRNWLRKAADFTSAKSRGRSERAANAMDILTGRARDERHIFAERVDRPVVLAIASDLREPDADDVGADGPVGGAGGVGRIARAV